MGGALPGSPALLLMLLDSRAPAGAHGHSGGMEAAVTAGFVTGLPDVAQFCRQRLRTTGQVAAAFAAAAARLWLAGAEPGRWADLDAELSARIPSPAARQASRQLGSGLRRLVTAMAPEPEVADLAVAWTGTGRPAPHHPLVLGAAVAIAGGGPPLAAVAAALGTCSAPASAAVRLLGLDPYAVQAMLAELAPEISRAGDVYGAGDDGAGDDGRPGGLADDGGLASLPAWGAPAMELLADVHARSEVRLFAS